jgi:hypothetical protein
MSLSPLFSIAESEDATSLNLTDITGTYSLSTNPGGYGSPNIEWADVLKVGITLTLPGSDTPLTEIFKLFAQFDGDRLVVLDVGDFTGTGSEFEDGVYELTYKVYNSGSVVQGTYTAKFLLFAQTYELLKSATLAMLLGTGCGCTGDNSRRIVEVRTLLLACRYAAIEEAYDAVSSGIIKIKRMAENICEDC